MSPGWVVMFSYELNTMLEKETFCVADFIAMINGYANFDKDNNYKYIRTIVAEFYNNCSLIECSRLTEAIEKNPVVLGYIDEYAY